MNIKGLQPGNIKPSSTRDVRTEASKHVEKSAFQPEENTVVRPEERDQAVFSSEARTASADAKLRELAFARKALLNIPPLTEEKLKEVQQRIRESYYTTPEIAKELAEKLVDVFRSEG